MKTIDVGNSVQAYYAAATSSTATEIIHVAGQPGTNAQGNVPADYESQVQLALLNLRRVLLAAGAQVSDILKLTLYMVGYDPAKRLHTRHIQKFLNAHRPAVTLVPVPSLAGEGWLFEIEAVVARHKPAQLITPPVSAPAQTVDVVIIGAGLAGLTAAARIIQSGLSCVVLEARDRVGGRTWSTSVSTNDGIVDLGAAWINDTNQSHMIALARRFNLELVEQNTSGNAVLQTAAGDLKHFAYGDLPPFEQTIQDNVAFIRDKTEADCQLLDSPFPRNPDLDSMTFAAYLRRNNASEDAFQSATVWTRAMLGHDPEDISALFFLSYCKSGGGLLQMRSDRKGGGQHLRLRHGTQQFAERLAAELPQNVIHLSTAVSSIEQLPSQRSNLVHCTAANKTYQAQKIISAIPLPVLKTLAFNPPLPLSKRLLIDSFRYGFYQKVLLVFHTPFWTRTHSCGLVQSFRGPAAVIRDTSVPADKKFVLTAFLAGTPGQVWSRHPQTERERLLLQQISAVFKLDYADVEREVVEFVTLPWGDEEWTGYGCPSPALPPGVLDVAGDAIRAACGNVHFVGTETSEVWKGYMEGAVRSGVRGAEEVVGKLKGGEILAKL